MAKRRAFLLIGMPASGSAVIPAAVATHADALAEHGLRQPATSEDEMFRAAVEIRRDHRAFGLRRRDVEGVWSGICRRTRRDRDDVFVGHDLLAAAQPDEVALLLDGLAGFAVHLIVVAAPPDPRVTLFPGDHDLGDVLRRWAPAAGRPDRVHVVVADPADPRVAWRAVGRVIGFDADLLPLDGVGTPAPHLDVTSLRLLATASDQLAAPRDLVACAPTWAKQVADAGYDVHGDVASLRPYDAPGAPATVAHVAATLGDTLAEVTRLREQVRGLEERNEKLARKRRRLKRRLADTIHA